MVSAGPTGEVASLAEANEIRVVFSEPMAALGQVPARLRPPYFRITPAVAGTFRWSGTPTARLLRTEWYRPGGRYDAAPLFVLRFNQPVRPADVAPHIRAAFESHTFTPPVIGQAAQAGLKAIDPNAMDAFAAKVQRARTPGRRV